MENDNKDITGEQNTDSLPEVGQKPKETAKPEYRKHRLSTGVLIIWLMATAVLSMVVGGFAGAIIQKGMDERNFEIERNSLNDKIATLESTAEENQKELVELREFRKKLEDLITEYMILDTQKQAANVANENINATLDDVGALDNKEIDGQDRGVLENQNKEQKLQTDDKETGGLFEWLMGSDTENSNESSTEKDNVNILDDENNFEQKQSTRLDKE